MNLPEMNEQNAQAGTVLNTYQVAYDRAAIEQYLARSGEPMEPYVHNGVCSRCPRACTSACTRGLHGTFHYEAGVHTASEMEVYSCPDEGVLATVSGEIVRTFERNGDKYVAFTVRVSDAGGRLLAKVEHTSIYGLRSRA